MCLCELKYMLVFSAMFGEFVALFYLEEELEIPTQKYIFATRISCLDTDIFKFQYWVNGEVFDGKY